LVSAPEFFLGSGEQGKRRRGVTPDTLLRWLAPKPGNGDL
jgi:hypothetical protein